MNEDEKKRERDIMNLVSRTGVTDIASMVIPEDPLVTNPKLRLVKFCPCEFNIANGCNTLKIGTLQYYREMETTEEIADMMEGFSKSVVGNKNLLVQAVPNFYIYCTSLDDKPKFTKYNDKFYINDVSKFKALINQELSKQITPEDLKGIKITGYVAGNARDVLYGKIAPTTGTRRDILFNAMFRKPSSYAHEKEFRMCFQIGDENKQVLPVRKEPKLLNISGIRSELDEIISLT